MLSLRELLNLHPRLLLLDAASARVQVGWFAANQPAAWADSSDEAAIALFACVERLDVTVSEADAFVFCDGPGSVLGIRTASMAIRAWTASCSRPIFAYHSLALVAAALEPRDATVIADARRESWHAFKRGGSLQRVPASELAGDLVMPENFRTWTKLPPNVALTPYTVADLLKQVPDAPLFRATAAPDAFLHEEPSYVQWTPQIHRAP